MIRTTIRTTAITLIALAAAAEGGLAEQFTGEIRPVNDGITDASPTGSVTVTAEGDDFVIEVTGTNFSEGMHLAHLHGFATEDPEEAACATVAADENEDGIVDLIETREVSGVTMIPVIDDPASLQIQNDTYPVADESGRLYKLATANLPALTEAVREKFGSPPAPGRRVVYFHGVPDGTALPGTVRSLEGVPASVTVPVACAELDPAS